MRAIRSALRSVAFLLALRNRFRGAARIFLAIAVTMLLQVAPAQAQSIANSGVQQGGGAKRVDIWVLTFGPGDHPFSKFGHDGFWVHDEEHGSDLVYNYGTYQFDSPYLIVDFLKSRFKYWVSVQSFLGTVMAYEEEGRSLHAQKLRLSPEKAREVRDFLRWNARVENRIYPYDYYRDNCSTRVRDVVDKAVSGKLREASRAPATMSFRAHTMRLTADSVLVYFGLYMSLNDFIDKPIDQWAEMFLPSELERGITRTQVDSPSGPVPLVEEDRQILTSARVNREHPPAWSLPLVGIGALLAVVLVQLGRWAGGSASARIALGMSTAVAGLVTGLVGLLFCLLWFFTNHDVAYHNENLAVCAPWGLALAWLGLRFAATGRGLESLRRVTLLSACVASAGVVAKVLPWFDQDNWQMLSLLVPLWWGIALGMRFAARADGASSGPQPVSVST